ncbi:MAG: HAMP domain-containing protein [Calditrichaeota bacterium]|nr:MAG: HAMP domain-containing protein [Calditrichota bacterium]
MRWNINKWLKLHIRGKLAIAFTGLSILPVLVVGLWGISYNVKSLRYIAINNLNHDVLTIREKLQAFIQGLEDNLFFIMNSSAFKHYLASPNNLNQSNSNEDEFLNELMHYARSKGIFYQIKLINKQGDEIFVIERQGNDYTIIPQSSLNVRGNSFYRYLATRIKPHTMTFIPVELISRDQQILIPAISCIYPVDRENFHGLFILQIYAQDFFKIIEEYRGHFFDSKLMLVNSEGFYLYHSKKKKEWNKLLASKDSLNLGTDYGLNFAQKTLNRGSISIHEIGQEILAATPIFNPQIGLNNSYILVKSVSKSEIFAPVHNFTRMFAALVGFFLLFSLFLSYLATQQFTGPIDKLKREAQVITQGNYQARVEVQTYDEIEELARQFNIMAESLEQREAEITRHREHLEQLVKERTRALENEKDKLRVILDNVPSGFLLLDCDLKIVAASAALQPITGKSITDILGQSCHEVIGNEHLCSACPTENTFRSGRTKTQVIHLQNGEDDRYLEFTAIPLKKNGQVEHVLEIITDITERKRLQDRLIHSEKLAVTGEMAAVIAHEMRNSLTSVRMILQLFAENKKLADTDRDSLEVALDSLNRMEKVVHDLLQLARPAPMQKAPQKINEVIYDSLELARHQIERKGITLEINVADELPEVEIDREHIKEALMNLILNASQAIENQGKIQITCKKRRLPFNLRTLGEVRVLEDNHEGIGVKEVFIKKGTQVVQIEVKDNGCGIPKKYFNRIFDPFFTTKINGTGLGLSFVKRVVNEHGGVIVVQSKVGEGSSFTIYLPVNNHE